MALTCSHIENPFGGKIFYKEICESTMLEARGMPIEGSIYLADHQTRPQARFNDRTWSSLKNENLTFTLAIKQNSFAGPAPLLTALGIRNCLEEDFSVSSLIKWPNDLLIDNKKICGILCQVYNDVVLVGVGFNVNQKLFPKDLRAVSLSSATGKVFEREAVLNSLLRHLKKAYSYEKWRGKINSHLWKKGEKACYQLGDSSKAQFIEGIVTEVSDDGALLIKQQGQGLYPIYSGEATALKSNF
jgi:BirA family biotin operon repressor/biotin-[acetyl-CoA-carboxylase] ligase